MGRHFFLETQPRPHTRLLARERQHRAQKRQHAGDADDRDSPLRKGNLRKFGSRSFVEKYAVLLPAPRTSMRMRLFATMRQISAQPKRASIPERHRSAIPAIMALSDGEGICVSSRARARARAGSRGHISQGPHEAGAALPSRTNGRARALTLAMQSLQDCS